MPRQWSSWYTGAEMVKKDLATPATPPSTRGENDPNFDDQVLYQRNLFFAMVLSMSWQLAIVVIVPIVGGYMLDEHYHSSPWLTVAGLAVAALGIVGVLVRTVKTANERAAKGPGARQ